METKVPKHPGLEDLNIIGVEKVRFVINNFYYISEGTLGMEPKCQKTTRVND